MSRFEDLDLIDRNEVILMIGSFILGIRDFIKSIRELRDQEVHGKLSVALIQKFAGLRMKEVSEVIRSQKIRLLFSRLDDANILVLEEQHRQLRAQVRTEKPLQDALEKMDPATRFSEG